MLIHCAKQSRSPETFIEMESIVGCSIAPALTLAMKIYDMHSQTAAYFIKLYVFIVLEMI